MKYLTYSLAFAPASWAYLHNESVECKSNHICATILNQLSQEYSVENVENTANNRVRREAEGNTLSPFSVTKEQLHQEIVLEDVDGCHKVQKYGTSDANNPACRNSRYGITFKMPAINNYGCWCYGGEFWPGARDMSGFGDSVDEWDDACKAHHQGFDCIKIDAEIEGEVCEPNETDYLINISPQASGNYILECADENSNDWCKRRTCLVDLRFMARHWKLELDENFPNYESFGHAGYHGLSEIQGFEPTGSCHVPVKTTTTESPPASQAPYHNSKGGYGSGGRSPDPETPKQKTHVPLKRCCGDYPYRVWYDVNNERNMKCCSYSDTQINEDYGFSIKIGKVYNELTKQCCSDGVYNLWDGQC